MRPIDERTVLVTGATSGLGRQLAAGAAARRRRCDRHRTWPRGSTAHRIYEEILDATCGRPRHQLTAS
jgi:NAD(P)-dependent dehydrogenase (short-subunit alcohol dehydrogenase family)